MKCSLLVAKDPEDKTDLLITLHGDAIPVSSFFLLFLQFLFSCMPVMHLDIHELNMETMKVLLWFSIGL